MTDTRSQRGREARRRRAVEREETAEERRLAKLGVFPWPDGWPKPSTWDVPGTAKPKRRRRR